MTECVQSSNSFTNVYRVFIRLRMCLRFSIQVSLDKSDALVAKNSSGVSIMRVKEGYFSRISRIRRPKIFWVIEGPNIVVRLI